MKAVIGAFFLAAILGMVIVYPMYFLALNEFKKKLIELNKDAWEILPGRQMRMDLQTAYQALEASRKGQIGGIRLCDEVMAARQKAVRLLYAGLFLFMVVLAIGLTESILAK